MPSPIPQKNGLPVTTRNFSYADLVIREWGAEWNKPDTAYVMSNGRKFDCTDQYQTGIYRKP